MRNHNENIILLSDIERKLRNDDLEVIKDAITCLLSPRGVRFSGSDLSDSGLLDGLLNYFLVEDVALGTDDEVELSNVRHYYAKLFIEGCYVGDNNGSERFFKLVECLKSRLTELLETADACKDIAELARQHRFKVQRIHFYKDILVMVNTDEGTESSEVKGDFCVQNSLLMDELMKVVQLLSILNSISDCWQIFGLDKKPDDGSRFVVPFFKVKGGKKSCPPKRSYEPPWWFDKIIKPCPFMMDFHGRKELFYVTTNSKHDYLSMQDSDLILFKVLRENPLTAVSYITEWQLKWQFEFDNELGTGEGPTKEFFSLLGKDIQSYDRHVWLGDPFRDEETGQTYAYSSQGLYPSPLPFPSDSDYQSGFFFTGKSIAKAILDRQLLDVNFNQLFYKQLVRNNHGCDLKDLELIDPRLSNFLLKLMDTKMIIDNIKSDLLTHEERQNALENVTVDGCIFKDLSIDFTLPGFPEIEMIPGGSKILLDHSNITEYMFQVLSHYTVQESLVKMSLIKLGFEQVLPPSSLELFSPEEVELLICGEKGTQWTENVLMEALLLDDYTLDSQPIKFLLNLMTSFDDVEQRNFLEFVTSNRKMPVGGFRSLKPPLTICCLNIDNPDDCLPSSATCFNRLHLPPYSNFQVAKIKIMQAITDGRSSFQIV